MDYGIREESNVIWFASVTFTAVEIVFIKCRLTGRILMRRSGLMPKVICRWKRLHLGLKNNSRQSNRSRHRDITLFCWKFHFCQSNRKWNIENINTPCIYVMTHVYVNVCARLHEMLRFISFGYIWYLV